MIETETTGDVQTITLDNPGKRNALDEAALAALRTAIETGDAPVTYVHGAGAAFCAGADLAAVRAVAGDETAARSLARIGQGTMDAIEDSESIVVAGIDGPARGGGVELALACDIRVATPTATFAEPGVTLGIFGAWGGTRRLPRVVGDGHARDLALSGRVVDAATAADMGLVSRVTDAPRQVAEEIGGADAAALRTVKRLLSEQTDRETTNEDEADAFATLAADAAKTL